MKSEFEELCKIASSVGAAQGFDRIRQKHGLEDSERFTKLAFGKAVMSTGFKGMQKMAPTVQGGAKKTPMLGTNAKVGLGALGGATVGGAAGFGGGADYGAKKMQDTMMTNMSNQGFMDKLKTLYYYLTNNMQGVKSQLGGGQV